MQEHSQVTNIHGGTTAHSKNFKRIEVDPDMPTEYPLVLALPTA